MRTVYLDVSMLLVGLFICRQLLSMAVLYKGVHTETVSKLDQLESVYRTRF